MNDRNGKAITIGARCLFRTDGRKGWIPGTVRAMSTRREAVRVDDGSPTDGDLTRNGFTVSAWVDDPKDIDIITPNAKGAA